MVYINGCRKLVYILVNTNNNIQIDDFVTTKRYHELMRVIHCYNGSWTGEPMLECQDPLFTQLTHCVYVEEVTNHYPRRTITCARAP